MLCVVLLAMVVAPEPAAGTEAAKAHIFAVIKKNAPETPVHQHSPLSELVSAAELAAAELVSAAPQDLSELMGYLRQTREIAYQRTADPAHLCLEDRTLSTLLDRRTPAVPPEIVRRAQRRRETLTEAMQAHAGFICAPAPDHRPLPVEDPPPLLPVRQSPAASVEAPLPVRQSPASPVEAPPRRSAARIAVGSGLLVAGVGSTLVFALAMNGNARAVAQIAALERDILAERREPTTDELARQQALDARYVRGSAIAISTGILSAASLSAGVVLLALPPRPRRTLALPWGGMGGAGLTLLRRF